MINGQKLWNTAAGARDNTMNVYLKTDTSVHYRKGMSLFLIDNDMPGVKLNKLNMLGRHCAGTYEVFLTDVKVDAASPGLEPQVFRLHLHIAVADERHGQPSGGSRSVSKPTRIWIRSSYCARSSFARRA